MISKQPLCSCINGCLTPSKTCRQSLLCMHCWGTLVCLFKMSTAVHGSVKHRSFLPGLCQKQIACRTSLVTCTEVFWASQTHHSIAVSGICAVMLQVMCVTLTHPKELPLGSSYMNLTCIFSHTAFESAILKASRTVQAKETQMQEWRMHARRQQHLKQGSQVQSDAQTDVVAAMPSRDQVQSASSNTKLLPFACEVADSFKLLT